MRKPVMNKDILAPPKSEITMVMSLKFKSHVLTRISVILTL